MQRHNIEVTPDYSSVNNSLDISYFKFELFPVSKTVSAIFASESVQVGPCQAQKMILYDAQILERGKSLHLNPFQPFLRQGKQSSHKESLLGMS